jgi:phosphoglycolate phosphatase
VDLDNTLYDFPLYYESGLQAVFTKIERRFGMTKLQVADRLRAVFARYQSIEYPFVIEEIPEVLALSDTERFQFVRDVVHEFWSCAARNLTLYPGVLDGLTEVRRQRIPVVAYTDAPINEAMRRIRRLNLEAHITGIVAQQSFRRRPKRTFTIYARELPGFAAPSRRMKLVWRVATSERKPSITIYRRLTETFNISPELVTVVGDSVQRDLIPAVDAGMAAVWASYGQRDGRREDLLQSVIPHRLPELGSRATPEAIGAATITRFNQVVEHMPIQQLIWLGEKDEHHQHDSRR